MFFNNTFWNNSDEMGAWHKAGTAFTNVRVWNNLGFKGEWEPQSDKKNNLIAQNTDFNNIADGKFNLTNGASAIDKGIEIASITDGFKGAAPDVGAYEYNGELWLAGIDWNPKLGPANRCYNLPGEDCESSVLSTDDLSYENDLVRLFPNPVDEVLKIKMDMTEKAKNVTVYSLLGEELIRKEVNQDALEVEVGGLNSGIYILSINNGEKKLKFVKR